jgi:hypothetical protein
MWSRKRFHFYAVTEDLFLNTDDDADGPEREEYEEDFDDNSTALSNCVGWRQTGGCKPEGPLEPFFSAPCNVAISGPSGYCLCMDGLKAGSVSCAESQNQQFTCMEVCAANRSKKQAQKDRRTEKKDGAAAQRNLDLASQIDVLRRRIARHKKAMQRSLQQMIKLRRNDGDTARLSGRARKMRMDEASGKYLLSLGLAQEAAEALGAVGEVPIATVLAGTSIGCIGGWRSAPSCDEAPSTKAPPMTSGDADLPCDAVVASDRSGFCNCQVVFPNGTLAGRALPVDVVPCIHDAFTCNQFCSLLWNGGTLSFRARRARQKMIYRETTDEDRMNALEMSQPDFGLRHLLALNAVRQGLPNPDPEALRMVSDALTPNRIHELDEMLESLYAPQPTTTLPPKKATRPKETAVSSPRPKAMNVSFSNNAVISAPPQNRTVHGVNSTAATLDALNRLPDSTRIRNTEHNDSTSDNSSRSESMGE